MYQYQWSYIGWQKEYPLSHPNATLAQQARASGENLNYVTLAPQARQARLSGEILNYLLSRYSDILSMIIDQYQRPKAPSYESVLDVRSWVCRQIEDRLGCELDRLDDKKCDMLGGQTVRQRGER